MDFPMTFDASSFSSANGELWTTDSPGGHLSVCIPKEFGGSGGAFSPEDLLCMAAANCFVGTFKVWARNSKLSYRAIAARATTTVDKGQKGPVLTSLHIEASLSGVPLEDRARAERLIKKVSENCIVVNSIGVPKTFDIRVD